ncbi:MAG: hypothetical protein A4E62_00108 [Syntrophorhabdus sp. PtaU1.Bin002]|nr:MAG: hypothetical protein A4E62_00108 [Syntrophorhabdus sp. PtaU1.Bin002]
MNKAKLIIAVALILLVGIFAGSLGTRMYLKHQLEQSETGRSRHHEDKVKKTMERLTDDLSLTGKQQDEIRKIILLTDAKVTGIKASYQPDVSRIYNQSFALIKEKLDDEQKRKLQARQERLSRRYGSFYFRSLRIAQTALPDIAMLKDRLGLNKTQESQVTRIVEDQRAQQEQIIGKYENRDNPDLAAVRSELAEVEKTMTKRISEVLTGEQMARYRAMQ